MRLEWLVLADAAQLIGGKLFLLGGGWETMMVNTLPVQHQMALALAFDVTWNETNHKHQFEVKIQDQDGNERAKIQGAFEVGRPPGIPAGQSQRFQLVVPANLVFEQLGTYEIRVILQDEEQHPVRFHVAAGPLFGVAQQLRLDNPDAENTP